MVSNKTQKTPPFDLSKQFESTVRHRPEIDGMRAIAVLSVAAYHVGVSAVHGGFVGVDIFFVISGYLITQVIMKDVWRGNFSLVHFYERRIRRILPALIAVLACTTFVYQYFSLPQELIDYSKSLLSAALSVSNIYFWLNAGYFDTPALSKPLLHTWSLAVEEQFYLFWPIFLVFVYRYLRRYVVPITATVVLASFVISSLEAFYAPNSSFYLATSRAWELLVGAVISFGSFKRQLGPWARNSASLLGIALITGSIFLIKSNMPFPGILAVPPCIGAALIIVGCRDGSTLVGRVLSLPPIVFVGLISYSLYLWHWPIIVLERNYGLLFPGSSDKVEKLGTLAICLIAGTLSWKFIEQPFRTGTWRPRFRPLMWMAGSGVGAVVLLGLIGWSAGGFPGRYSESELKIASYTDRDASQMIRNGQCFISEQETRRSFSPECLRLAGDRPNYLLLGDSHAGYLWTGLASTYPAIHFLQATAPLCFPTVHHNLGESAKCSDLFDGIFQDYLLHNRVDMVVLAARWGPDVTNNLRDTLAWLKDHHLQVTLLGPYVVYDSPFPRLLLRARRTNNPGLLETHWDHSLRVLDKQLREIAETYDYKYVSLIDLTCRADVCINTDSEGMPLLIDREHFTPYGSWVTAQLMKGSGLWSGAEKP